MGAMRPTAGGRDYRLPGRVAAVGGEFRRNVARQLIASHLAGGEMRPASEIALTVDQTLTQDATGTLVMLELA
jgi:hypothetical protein